MENTVHPIPFHSLEISVNLKHTHPHHISLNKTEILFIHFGMLWPIDNRYTSSCTKMRLDVPTNSVIHKHNK